MMTIWEELDSSESNTETKESDEVNICLVAEDESDNEVLSDFDELKSDYLELLEDSHAILNQYRILKKKYLERLMYTEKLKEQNHVLLTQIFDFEMNIVPDRTEEVKKLIHRITELSKDLSNLTESKKIMNKILGIYRHPKDKSGIGSDEMNAYFKKKKKNMHS